MDEPTTNADLDPDAELVGWHDADDDVFVIVAPMYPETLRLDRAEAAELADQIETEMRQTVIDNDDVATLVADLERFADSETN